MQNTAAGVDVRASGPETESDRTVSRGASDVHWGVWIQAPTLLGPREVVRTAANMPRPCSTRERSGPMQRRLDRTPEASKLRRQTVEHPFATLKAWIGATHFLTKTLPKVRREVSLHVLAYNMKRAMNLLGGQGSAAGDRRLGRSQSRELLNCPKSTSKNAIITQSRSSCCHYAPAGFSSANPIRTDQE
jgi:hypothetical protein